MDEPRVGVVLEYVGVALEAYCAGLTAKQRVTFLRRMEARFKRQEDTESVSDIKLPATTRADRKAAHAAFKDALPRLMAP